MDRAHFGLLRRPFASVPNTDQYFPAAAIEAARQTLVRCVDRGEGVGILIGPSGTGKTLLVTMLAAHFRRDAFAVAQLASGRLSTRRSLFQSILYELARPYRGLDEGEARLALLEYLTNAADGPESLVLLVDEAHTLPLRLLDELRMLGNLVRDAQPRVRLVLAGHPLLEERFASPRLESFSQRVVARCYLDALDRQETEQYITAQLAAAGARNRKLFPPETCRAVYHATDGVPRLVNQVCDYALLLADTAGCRTVTAECVEEAWADLQQLPPPWSGGAEGEASSPSIIEFGRLDDEAEPVPSPGPALRVTDDEDTEPDPEEQLDHLEAALHSIESKPEGDPQPPSAVCATAVSNPFDEAFDEEEIVTDRFVYKAEEATPAASSELFVRAGFEKGVSGRDAFEPSGQRTSEWRESPPAEVAEASASAAPPEAVPVGEEPPPSLPCDAPVFAESYRRYPAEPEQRPEVATLRSVSSAGPEPAAMDAEPEEEATLAAGEAVPTQAHYDGVAASRDGQSPTVPLVRPEESLSAAPDEVDLVVEEGYRDAAPPDRARVVAVRPQEFRNLFARLRKA